MPINNCMSHRIRCYTLFDITKTNVTYRSKPIDDVTTWLYNRNTQCNFDTILQVISLRSQPEVVKNPEKKQTDKLFNFGSLYDTITHYWVFEFEVQHSSVFDNGTDELGALYIDCNNVPMIKCDTEIANLATCLDTSAQLKNIHFEII